VANVSKKQLAMDGETYASESESEEVESESESDEADEIHQAAKEGIG
jgi:hypothetical protein